jgi:uncharacterized protein YqeY
MGDIAGSLRRAIHADLLGAMKAQDSIATAALRSVLSALDNASAVPISSVPGPVLGRSGDVPRKELTETDCRNIISAEARARSVAAEEYVRLGRSDAVARLRAEQAIIERYVPASAVGQLTRGSN